MSGNWQPGDIALCLKTVSNPYGESVNSGCFYTVLKVTQGATKKGLVLKETPSRNPLGWAAKRFIKITPPEADEFDRETIDLYNKQPQETETS